MKTYTPEELSKLKVVELRQLSKRHKLIGASQLRKADLVKRLARHLAQLAADDSSEVAELKASPESSRRKAAIQVAASLPTGAGSAEPGSEVEERPAQEAGPGDMRDPSWYPPELPESYGHERLTLMVRDPHWLFCYWELDEDRVAAARAELDGHSWKILRVHLLGEDESVMDGWEHGLPESARSWYVHTGRPGALFRAEIGLTDAAGRYRCLITSNVVRAPMDSPSERWDEEWIGLSRESWEHLERRARPFPGSLAGLDLLRREMKVLAAARLGASESFASPPTPDGQAKKVSRT